MCQKQELVFSCTKRKWSRRCFKHELTDFFNVFANHVSWVITSSSTFDTAVKCTEEWMLDTFLWDQSGCVFSFAPGNCFCKWKSSCFYAFLSVMSLWSLSLYWTCKEELLFETKALTLHNLPRLWLAGYAKRIRFLPSVKPSYWQRVNASSWIF